MPWARAPASVSASRKIFKNSRRVLEGGTVSSTSLAQRKPQDDRVLLAW